VRPGTKWGLGGKRGWDGEAMLASDGHVEFSLDTSSVFLLRRKTAKKLITMLMVYTLPLLAKVARLAKRVPTTLKQLHQLHRQDSKHKDKDNLLRANHRRERLLKEHLRRHLIQNLLKYHLENLKTKTLVRFTIEKQPFPTMYQQSRTNLIRCNT
jgi:hypothetical protein